MTGTVRLFAAADGTPLRSLRDYHGWVNCLAFSPDGKTLALAGADTQSIHVWDVATGRDLRPHDGHHGQVQAVAYSPDGRLLASAGGDKQDEDTAIRVWNAAAGSELRRLEGHAAKVHCLAFSPDGQLLASGGEKEDFVRLWDAAAGGEVRRLQRTRPRDESSPDRRVSALAFSPRGDRLAAGLDEGGLVVWQLDGTQRHRLAGHEGRITSVAFSPDGKYLVSGGLDRAVRVWDLAEGREVRQFGRHDDTIRTVAFSPDGRLLVAGSGDWQGTVWLWDAASGREVGRIALDQTRLFHLAFSPDGHTLAIGCAGDGLRLWEVATRKERRRLQGHPGGVHTLAFAPDGKTLASGSADSTVLLWDVSGPDTRSAPLTAERLEALWEELGGEDAGRAEGAVRALLAEPRRAVPFLRSRLSPAAPLSPQQLADMVRDLDHTRFQVRERATSELARLGEMAEPLLRRQLDETVSPELRRRVEILLNRLDTDTLSTANLRALRAFEVLERIGGVEVRRVFEAHAREAGTARLGQEAQASLQRLGRRER
jgi:WD40 repeat protein